MVNIQARCEGEIMISKLGSILEKRNIHTYIANKEPNPFKNSEMKICKFLAKALT